LSIIKMHKRKNPSKTKYSMFLILPDEIKHGAVCRAVLKSSLQLYPSLIQLNKNFKKPDVLHKDYNIFFLYYWFFRTKMWKSPTKNCII